MPSTGTAINGCGAIIKLANAGGVLTDISGSSNEATIDFSSELGDYKLFNDANYYRLECGRDAEIKLSIVYTTAAAEAMDILKRWRQTRGKRALEITIGNDVYSGEVLMEKLSLPIKADEAKPIMVEANLKPNGAFDWIA